VAAQPQHSAACQLPSHHHNLTNIDTCGLRLHALRHCRCLRDTPHQSTSRLPSTLPWPCALSDTTQKLVGQRLEPSSSLHFNLLFLLT
jgi:hypothetical protein